MPNLSNESGVYPVRCSTRTCRRTRQGAGDHCYPYDGLHGQRPLPPLPSERDAEARGLEVTLIPRNDDATFDDAAAAQGLTASDGVKAWW